MARKTKTKTDYSLRFGEEETRNIAILRQNLLSPGFCVMSERQDPARIMEFLIKVLNFIDDNTSMEELLTESFVLYANDNTVDDNEMITFTVCDPARYTSLRAIGEYFKETPQIRIPRSWFNTEGHLFTNGTDYWSFLKGKVSFLIGICEGVEHTDYENIRFILPDEGFLSSLGREVSVGKLRPVDSSLMELYLSDLIYNYAPAKMRCLIRKNGLGGEKVYHIFSKNFLRVGFTQSLRYIREFFEDDGIETTVRSWKVESTRITIDMELDWNMTPNLEKFGYRPGVRLVLSDTGNYGLGMSAILFTRKGAIACAGSKKTSCISVKRTNHRIESDDPRLPAEKQKDIHELKCRMQINDLYKEFMATDKRGLNKAFAPAEGFFTYAGMDDVKVDVQKAYSAIKSAINLTTAVGSKMAPIMGRALAPYTMQQANTARGVEYSALGREKPRDTIPDYIDGPSAILLYREGTEQIRTALESIFSDEWVEVKEARDFCDKVRPFFEMGLPAAAHMLLVSYDTITLRPKSCPEKDKEFDREFWNMCGMLLTRDDLYRPDLVKLLIAEKSRGKHFMRAVSLIRDHCRDERLLLGSGMGSEGLAPWPQVIGALLVYAEEFSEGCGSILQETVMQSLGSAFEQDFLKLSERFGTRP